MSTLAQRVARRLWAGGYGLAGALAGLLLLPLSGLWRLVTGMRNRRFDRVGGVAVEGVRVISVGNLAVGGTGKTPFTSWVARRLGDAGRHPAIVLRGYGRDEALLHRRWTPDVPVVVDPDRVGAARRVAAGGADAVVLDDGFQHRRLARDLDLVLLAVEDPFPGPVLPRGPYREPATSLRRADMVVLTRRTASVDDARALAAHVAAISGRSLVAGCLRFVPDGLVPLGGRGEVEGRGPASPEAVLACTAIARGGTFRTALLESGVQHVELMAFGDHHDFDEHDVRRARVRAGIRPIVVTEKDAVKLTGMADTLGDAWVLRQRIEWDWGEADVAARLLSEAMA